MIEELKHDKIMGPCFHIKIIKGRFMWRHHTIVDNFVSDPVLVLATKLKHFDQFGILAKNFRVMFRKNIIYIYENYKINFKILR